VRLAAGRGTASGDPVRLLYQRDGEPFRERHVSHRHQVSRGHASAGSVTEHERGAGVVGRVEVDVCLPVRRIDFEEPHARATAQASSEGRSKRAKTSGVTNAVISLISAPSNVMTSIAAGKYLPVSASRW
jgi:hypothetical protein